MSRASLSPVLQQVITRLEEWAEWYSREQEGGLGYPSSSLEYRHLRGSRTRRAAGLPVQASHAAAEEIEGWVMEMAQQNRPMATALRVRYFHRGVLQEQAASLAISRTEFQKRVGMAHQWLAGRLGAQSRPFESF